jgi:hypothetical protein
MPADWIGLSQSVFHFRAVQRRYAVQDGARLSSKARSVMQDFFILRQNFDTGIHFNN